MEKVSIIVPVYNTEDYLAACIESILKQSYKNIELILINDGSTDLSGIICDDYLNKDSRVKVKHKPNGGQSSARNMGIDIATGSYIGFVDSDDWIHESMYDKLIRHAVENKSDIVACNFNVMHKNGEFSLYTSNAMNVEFDRDDAMKEIYTNKILTFSPCNKIYRNEIFKYLRFKDGIILEDMDIAYRLINTSNKVSYLKEGLYYYRYNKNSTLRSKFTIKRLDEYKVRNDMYDFYKENYPETANQVYYEFCKIRSFLFLGILESNIVEAKKYKYLIQYDKKVLSKVLKHKDLMLKDRIKVYMLIKYPNIEINIRRVWFKVRATLDSLNSYR